MPRVYARRRKTYRKKNYRRKKTYRRRIPRRITNKIYSFKRTFEATQITAAAGGIFQSVFSPSIGDCPNVTDFTNLFDMYRICGIKIKLVPIYDAALSSAINKFSIFSVIDYNDLNTITQAQAMEYQNVKRSTSVSGHNRYFKPKIAINQTDVSSTAFTASYKAPWISCANTNIAHGFLKMVSDTNSGSAVFNWNVYCTLYMQFKNVR